MTHSKAEACASPQQPFGKDFMTIREKGNAASNLLAGPSGAGSAASGRGLDAVFIHEVADFFDMWSRIEEGFAALEAPDQEAFRGDKDILPPVFQGFDGKGEREYKRAAQFMIANLERFEGFAGRDLESYHPVVACYRQVLEAFRPIWREVGGRRPLTAGELRAILACPSGREWSP